MTPTPRQHKTLSSGRFWRRLLVVQWLAIRHGLDEIILTIPLLRKVRPLRWLLPWNWFSRQDSSDHAIRLRRFLEDAGPIYIKLGQALSTRSDLLPADVIKQLSQLQDNVPPFPGEQAQALIEKTYHQPIDQLFDDFDAEPLASASIAQVHTAKLKSGESVVIKVLRPKIEKTIKADLAVMYTIARLAEKYHTDAKRLRLTEVIREYERTINDELDLLNEAANAAQIKRNFADSEIIQVPEIYWDYVRRDVMVMERMYGIPVSNIDEMRAAGVDMELLAKRGVEIFFKQVFRDSFFHADMHPGNIFVDIKNPADPTYVALDFGIVGSLSPEDQSYLAENLLAFFNQDYRRVAELHVESGWVASSTRINEFESTIRAVCEPVFNKPISEISFGHFLLTLFNTARRYDMVVQPQLVLLQKTLLHVEGLGRLVYPELDLWDTGKPILEQWMHDRIGVSGIFKKSKKSLPKLLNELPELPLRAIRIIEQIERGELTTQVSQQSIDNLLAAHDQQQQRSQRRQRRHLGLLVILLSLGFGLLELYGISLSTTTLCAIGLVLGLALIIH